MNERDSSTELNKLPRPGSMLYSIMCGDKEARKKAIKRFKLLNKYITVPLYRAGILPLFGFGRLFLLLYTKGRKTGKTRITPLEYHRIDGVIHIFSSRGMQSDWIKNMLANPDAVQVRIGFRKFKPEIELVEDKSEKEKIMRWYVTKHPKYAKSLMGWDPKRDTFETVDISDVLNKLAIVRLYEPKKE